MAGTVGYELVEQLVRTLAKNSDGVWLDSRQVAFAGDEGAFEWPVD